MLIWARLSIWNTPIVSARQIMSYTAWSPSGIVASVSAPPGVLADQVEAFANGGQHAQRQAIDFEDAQLVEIVLVPLDHRAAFHGGVFDRHQLAQRALGHHHAADVLPQMARKADQLAHQAQQPAADVRLRIDAAGAGRLRPARQRGGASRLLASASTRSSDRPSALPTSRTAERGR